LFRVEGRAGEPDPIYQVVGAVKNTKYYELREDFVPISFLLITQNDGPGTGADFVLRIVAPLRDILGRGQSHGCRSSSRDRYPVPCF
jgi:hypothetical protein